MSFMFYINPRDPNPQAQKLLRILKEKYRQQKQNEMPFHISDGDNKDILQMIKDHAHIIHELPSVKRAVPQDSDSDSFGPSCAQRYDDELYHNPYMCACHGSSQAISPEQQHPTSNEDSSEQVQPSSPSQPPISEHSGLQLRKEAHSPYRDGAENVEEDQAEKGTGETRDED